MIQRRKCPWRDRIERGEYRDKAWEEAPCSRHMRVKSSTGMLAGREALALENPSVFGWVFTRSESGQKVVCDQVFKNPFTTT